MWRGQRQRETDSQGGYLSWVSGCRSRMGSRHQNQGLGFVEGDRHPGHQSWAWATARPVSRAAGRWVLECRAPRAPFLISESRTGPQVQGDTKLVGARTERGAGGALTNRRKLLSFLQRKHGLKIWSVITRQRSYVIREDLLFIGHWGYMMDTFSQWFPIASDRTYSSTLSLKFRLLEECFLFFF